MPKTYAGYFLIADITGYTQYLTESELEHAQETLTALLQLLVENTRPPLIISRLAGDAVISYGLQEDFFEGQSFIEKIEDTYVTFRKTLERLVLNNTCQCNACANISNLDLKFFVHYGTFGIQRISDLDELVGSDINLIHRLLKNSITETTGFKAYALYTDEALRQLDSPGLDEFMTPHNETYEHLGEVQVWVQDMHPVWAEKRASTRVPFPEDKIWAQYEVLINIPLEQVWDYMTQPEFRIILTGSDRMEITNRSKGRLAAGSVYQCYHGDKLVPQTILEWQPFERMLIRELSPIMDSTGGISEYRLEETADGTVLTKAFGYPEGPLVGRTIMKLAKPMFNRVLPKILADFRDEIEKDYQSHGQGPASRVEISSQLIEAAAAAELRNSAEG